MVDTLSNHATRNEPSFILIDSLDENWIDVSIKYPLIRALIESLKSLRRVSDLKTVVALRSDLLEKVILETRDAGFQSEKYEDYIVRIKWDGPQLKRLINKRINFLFRRKYEKQNVTFEDIFSERVANSNSAFSTILEKSLNRPRDIINFVNMCLDEAQGSSSVSRKHFNIAERNYSANRLTAMVEEWQNVVLGANDLVGIIKGKRETFPVSELCSSDLLDYLIHHFPSAHNSKRDNLWQLVEDATTKRTVAPFELASLLIEKLHLMGAIGVKIDPSLPYQFFFQTQKPLPTVHLQFDTKIRVHPMLHSALGNF